MNSVEWTFIFFTTMLCVIVSTAFGIVLGFLINKLNTPARPDKADVIYSHYACTRGE